MGDLTVIFITANKTPEAFAAYQRHVLLNAIAEYPLIVVSREPMDFGVGTYNLIDNEPMSYENIYRQILRAAKFVTTDYIAIAEDDVLYSKEHFSFFRPEKDTFAYNQHRWALFTWGVPTYNIRQRKSNCSLIAPRLLLIEALEERFAKYPNGMPLELVGEVGRYKLDLKLGVTVRKSMEVYCEVPIIQINHNNATEDRQARGRKSLGQIKAYDIPYWGKAEELIKHYR